MMTPKYTRGSVNRIGKLLVADDLTLEQRNDVLDQLNDWRSLHLYPLNTFQATLRKYVKEIDPKQGIVAQRLKRTPTIIDKLKNRHQVMKLGEMQDIGGLRAIVSSIAKVRELEKKYDRSKAQHVLRRKKDYIAEPQESGYRGVHLVYSNVNPRNHDYDDLLIEIQLRTHLQHIWATTVETVGTFYQESFKSSQGSQMWLDFFKLVSAVFAREEGQKPHEAYHDLTYKELLEELKKYIDRNSVFVSLNMIHAAESFYTTPPPKLAKYFKNTKHPDSAGYLVITLEPNTRSVMVVPISRDENLAKAAYRTFENYSTHTVLVSVDSIKKIENAYPNFYLNISDFSKELNRLYNAAK